MKTYLTNASSLVLFAMLSLMAGSANAAIPTVISDAVSTGFTDVQGLAATVVAGLVALAMVFLILKAVRRT